MTWRACIPVDNNESNPGLAYGLEVSIGPTVPGAVPAEN